MDLINRTPELIPPFLFYKWGDKFGEIQWIIRDKLMEAVRHKVRTGFQDCALSTALHFQASEACICPSIFVDIQ